MKMSLTRALVELKHYDTKINSAIVNGTYCAITVGTDSPKVLNSNDSVLETKNKIQSSFDKVNALINARAALKSAIVKTNANTFVTIQNRTMTIAEAVEFKSQIQHKRTLLSHLMHQSSVNRNAVSSANSLLDASIEKQLLAICGSDKSKLDETTASAVRIPQEKAKKQELLDPANIAEKIQTLQDEVNSLESEINFTLSEINSRTDIEIDIVS